MKIYLFKIKILLIIFVLSLSGCVSYEELAAEQRETNRQIVQKIKEICSGLGLKSGTTEYNVCVDRKIDNINLAIGINRAANESRLRDLINRNK